MAALLDTDVAIELRDGEEWVKNKVRELTPPLYVSAITRVELENGVHRDPELAVLKRARLDRLLETVATLDFTAEEIGAFRGIIDAAGYSRRKTADRMTAATALVLGLPLVTFNVRDFRDVPGLDLIGWVRPEE